MAKTTLTLKKALDVLEKSCKDAVLSSQEWERDDRVVVASDKIIAVLKTLKEHKDLGFEFLMDQTAVDYMGDEQRFEVIYQLYSLKHNYRLRIKTRVGEESCEIDTATGLWKAADWFEREIWDMYGITFKGHPNLRRLLMYEEFEGHPLRKDYPLKGHQPIVALRKPIEPPKEFQYQLSPAQRRARLDLED